MAARARGTFDVTITPQTPDDPTEAHSIARMSVVKQFHGDLDATSVGQMLAVDTDVEGSAGYVAMEGVTGRLHGRGGTFALQHNGTMARGVSQLTVTVVPDSGTAELTGLAGTLTIIMTDGRHEYDFDYALADSSIASPPVESSPPTGVDEQGRPGPPDAGDEIATLLGTLERNRATLAWKCGGLDAAGLRATVAASSITLGGLLKHLALVEDDYFSVRLHGHDRQPPWDAVDWEADPNWEWRSAAEDTPEHLYALWQEAVARSRSLVAQALADGGLERLARRTWPDGQAPSLRRLLVDMIEEYARHTGHADLIREVVDGLVGEGSTDIHPPYQLPASEDRA